MSARVDLKVSVRVMTSLEAVHQPAVRPKLHFLHDVLERDEVANVDCRRVLERGRGRVKVEQMNLPVERLGVGNDGRAEGRLARAGRAWTDREARQVSFATGRSARMRPAQGGVDEAQRQIAGERGDGPVTRMA